MRCIVHLYISHRSRNKKYCINPKTASILFQSSYSSRKPKIKQPSQLKQPPKQPKRQRKTPKQKNDKQTVIMPGSQMAFSRRRSFVCFQLTGIFLWSSFWNVTLSLVHRLFFHWSNLDSWQIMTEKERYCSDYSLKVFEGELSLSCRRWTSLRYFFRTRI